jgi:hypothetical protein
MGLAPPNGQRRVFKKKEQKLPQPLENSQRSEEIPSAFFSPLYERGSEAEKRQIKKTRKKKRRRKKKKKKERKKQTQKQTKQQLPFIITKG